MDKVKEHLKDTYHLTSYQAAQVIFLFKSLFSEFSKMLIMGILFHRHLPEYFFALFVMLFLRCTTGGIHFYTYWGCLLMSVSYVGLSILILPLIPVPFPIKIGLLLFAMLTCFIIGPIASKYRPTAPEKQIRKFRILSAAFILLYTIVMVIFPHVALLNVGFWVIIMHSAQLIVAKILKKGAHKND